MSQLPVPSRLQAAVAAVAARQFGVITTQQLVAWGMAPSTISDWVRARRLHRLHRGVYAVGHRGLSIEGEWMAAVLACGEGAVLSHSSAAMLWRTLDPRRGAVHVSVRERGGRSRREGLRIHRPVALPADQCTRERGIAVTTPARTLEDLRASSSPARYRRALRQAEFRRLAVGDLPEADGTRSGLESSFLDFCGRHGLPIPEVSVEMGPFTADFLWRSQRVVVETDSYRTHGGPVAFEEDRERDLWMKANGFEVVRVTDRRLGADPTGLAGSLRSILRHRRGG